MVTPIEGLPDSLAGLFVKGDESEVLFRSPLRVYLLLLELTELSRRHGGRNLAPPRAEGALPADRVGRQPGAYDGRAADGGRVGCRGARAARSDDAQHPG